MPRMEKVYWQTESAMNSPVLEQSVLNIQTAKAKEKLAKSELLPKVALWQPIISTGLSPSNFLPIDKESQCMVLWA